MDDQSDDYFGCRTDPHAALDHLGDECYIGSSMTLGDVHNVFQNNCLTSGMAKEITARSSSSIINGYGPTSMVTSSPVGASHNNAVTSTGCPFMNLSPGTMRWLLCTTVPLRLTV